MPEQISNHVWKLAEYGPAGIVLAVVLACLVALMWWVLRHFEKVQARADKGQEIMVALKTAIAAGAITSSEAPNLDVAVSTRGTGNLTASDNVGINWGDITNPTTSVGLSGTTISTSQQVASVSGAVGSVTGNVGGNLGGNVNGSVGSVTGAVGSVTGNIGGNLAGNVGGNVNGSVGSVVGNLGGNVGGNVNGSVNSVTEPVSLNQTKVL